MASANGRTVKVPASAVAPFGRIGRTLGFRWVFPFGTMPIPFHPLILWALLIGIPLAIGWQIVATLTGTAGSGEPRWLIPFIVAMLLAIPLSIPIVSWLTLVFAGPLIQAMLFAGSMLLLVADIASGRADARLAVLPAGFALLYLLQAFGGRLQLTILKHRAARWQLLDAGQYQLAVEGEQSTVARDWMRACAIDRLALIRTNISETCHWIGNDDAAELRSATPTRAPEGWSLPKENEAPVLIEPAIDHNYPTLWWRKNKFRSPMWLVTGDLSEIHIRSEHVDRRLVVGEGHVVQWLPLFVLFHWTALVGKSQWAVGFMRTRPVLVGPARNGTVETDVRLASFVARVAQASAGLAPDLRSRFERAVGAEQVFADSFYAELERNPRLIHDRKINPVRSIEAAPHLMEGHGEVIVKALVYAKENALRLGVWRAAVMLQHISDAEWQRCREPILDALSSKMLACAWPMKPSMDTSEIPKGTPANREEAGYALMRDQKRLYERLKQYGREGENLLNRIEAAVKKAAGTTGA